MDGLLNVAVKAARNAGQIMVRAFNRFDQVEVYQKGKNDYVSNIDRMAEAAIIETISGFYKHHGFLAEESGQIGSTDTRWIIDPIDGTNNFIHRLPHAAVSIAFEEQGDIKHGVIYDPFRDELFIATKGGGAQLNNQRVRVSNCQSLSQALLGTGFPERNPAVMDSYLPMFRNLLLASSGMRRIGAAALDLAYVACGRLDGFFEYHLNIWDYAAGALMITEAGGFLTDLSGGSDRMAQGEILAANPKIHQQMLDTIKQHPSD